MPKKASKYQRPTSLKSTGIGQVRIISGIWRGRKLPVLNYPGLRPTTNPIRETLFNWLAPVLPGAHCLDCFAGSGALGFEALSRGAKKVVLLEFNQNTARQLEQNKQQLNTQDVEVVNVDSLSWLAQENLSTPFDIIFLDPPFRHSMLENTLYLLNNQGWLADNCWLYTETELGENRLPSQDHWYLHREKITGQVVYRLYRRQVNKIGKIDVN